MKELATGLALAAVLSACGGAGESGSAGSGGHSTSASGSATTGSAGAGSSSAGATGHATSSATGGSTTGATSGGPCGDSPLTLDGLVVSQPLQLSASTVAPGETLTGAFTLCNPTSADIALKGVDIAARPPGGTDPGGPYGDLSDGPALTVPAGQSRAIEAGRPITSSDALGLWYAYVTLVDQSGGYHGDSTLPDNKVTFTVVPVGGTTGTTGGASTSGSTSGGAGSGSGTGAPSGLHVINGATNGGGHLVDGASNVIQLHGVDRSGTEFSCTFQSGGDPDAGFPGFFDGLNDQAGVDNLLSWHVNAVRVPLNEDCWLGLNGLPVNDTAAHYQAAIEAFVNLLNRNGLIAIVDLHWVAPGNEITDGGQLPMADADHAPAFWASVAATFAGNSSVIFDLFNEPYLTDWTCWAQGGPASANCAKDKQGNAYAVAGMASLLKAVRSAGAQNVVLLGGLAYASDFSSWVSAVETLPTLAAPLNGLSLDNVAASWHAYDFNSAQSGCPSQYNGYNSTCNSGQVTADNSFVTDVLDAGFPVVIGELGISAFSAASEQPFSSGQLTELTGWLESVMTFMDAQGQGYVAWSWNTNTPPSLITDDATAAPTPEFGATYQAHLTQF